MDPTVREAIDAVVRRIGFPAPRVRAVARELSERGSLPLGTPAKPPRATPDGVLDVIIGSALDVPLRKVSAEVEVYRSLVPAGISALTERKGTAGTELHALTDIAIADVAAFSSVTLEFVSNWREVAIHHDDGTVERYREGGSLASHWGQAGSRKSTAIAGAAFAAVFRDLFPQGA